MATYNGGSANPRGGTEDTATAPQRPPTTPDLENLEKARQAVISSQMEVPDDPTMYLSRRWILIKCLAAVFAYLCLGVIAYTSLAGMDFVDALYFCVGKSVDIYTSINIYFCLCLYFEVYVYVFLVLWIDFENMFPVWTGSGSLFLHVFAVLRYGMHELEHALIVSTRVVLVFFFFRLSVCVHVCMCVLDFAVSVADASLRG